MAATAGDIVLASLRRHGIEHFFANPGTDFPPIVEGFARAKLTGAEVPRPVLVPHENLAVAMAHGAYLMTGAPQALMVHVNVGTANTINLLANAARDRVPLLLMAGRSPIMEAGTFGARSRPIHWAQEMFDQAGMVREFVKWDYELRNPQQAGAGGRARGGSGDGRAARPRVPDAAARAVVGAGRNGRRSRAAQRPLLAASRSGADRAPRRLADRGRRPLLIASSVGRIVEEADALARHRRTLRAAGRRPHTALLCACRPTIRCTRASIPTRCWTTPI